MIRILYCGSSSACLELDGDAPYYAKSRDRVLVDGSERPDLQSANVFSLFGLRPATEYTVAVRFEDGGEEQVRLDEIDSTVRNKKHIFILTKAREVVVVPLAAFETLDDAQNFYSGLPNARTLEK